MAPIHLNLPDPPRFLPMSMYDFGSVFEKNQKQGAHSKHCETKQIIRS